MASSSEAMRVLELFELQSQEGPCLDCYRTGDAGREPGPRHRRRPLAPLRRRGARRRLPLGPRACPCACGARSSAPSTCSAPTPGEMGEADVDAAQAFADVATIAILQHRAAHEAQVVNEQLNHALNSRIVIEQAKGVVGER